MINMILLPESQNIKTGNIIQSYSSLSCLLPLQGKWVLCEEYPGRGQTIVKTTDSLALANALTGALWLDKGDVVLTSIYPKGIPAVQCPAQTKGITCKECRLCSRDRESVVLFEVHGQSKGKARRVIQIKRAQH